MYIADLHIHSKYSRATSKDCVPEYLDLWARRKGIDLLGTGDFTHPAWRRELGEKLVPAEEGLYRLKEDLCLSDPVSGGERRPRFVISGEISSIYKKNGQVRKVHNVILLPGLEEAEALSKKLEAIGNIHSDGRPILGLDCRDLLEITLEVCQEAIFVPAHIWTPHFSMFGAFSKFESAEECFEDLTPYIHAVETGLSSDPPMNWQLSALDRFQLISNSDAHSPSRLGREANLLETEMSYAGLYRAVQEGEGLKGTIEFFPEEGKYHFDGHRKCHVCLSPREAAGYNGICPVCGKKLTLGVSHRISQMADRDEGFTPAGARPFESLAPLPEVIASCMGVSAASRKVQHQYEALLRDLGSEFSILRELPLEDIRKKGGYFIAEGIRRLRAGEVKRSPGFDGEYGVIRLFEPTELDAMDGQMSLFSGLMESAATAEADKGQEKAAGNADMAGNSGTAGCSGRDGNPNAAGKSGISEEDTEGEPGATAAVSELTALSEVPDHLNEEQLEAVRSLNPRIAVIAGPGTGKTKTLVSRILYLLKERRVRPSEITAVTFTNQAAKELKKRLEEQLGGKQAVRRLRIGTFHSICYDLLRQTEGDFLLADRTLALELAEETIAKTGLKLKPKRFLSRISERKTAAKEAKSRDVGRQEPPGAAFDEAAADYASRLTGLKALDFDDLLLKALSLSADREDAGVCRFLKGFHYLLVDEFQDTSPLQYRLIEEWSRGGRELFAIGDPDQAIYGFRGADAESFLRFQEQDAQIIRLKKNYRSTPQILTAAKTVMDRGGVLEAVCRPGPSARLLTASGEREEAIFTAKEINRLVGGMDMLDAQGRFGRQEGRAVRSFAEIAVLYRTHRQSALLEMCLKKEGIPYIVAGREDYLDDPSVRGALSFFRSLLRPEDEAAAWLSRRNFRKLSGGVEADHEAEKEAPWLGERYQALAERFGRLCRRGRPSEILHTWMEETGCLEDPAMERLCSMALLHKNMEELINSIAFGRESDLKRCGGKTWTADAVTLMTLHGSKGLEYPVVFINGAGKGLIPLEYGGRAGGSTADVSEERRLFYVGMTRAREELIMSCAGVETPFLANVPEAAVRREQAEIRTQESRMRQLSLFDWMKP